MDLPFLNQAPSAPEGASGEDATLNDLLALYQSASNAPAAPPFAEPAAPTFAQQAPPFAQQAPAAAPQAPPFAADPFAGGVADPFATPPVDPFAVDPFAADPFGGAPVADPFAGQLADPFATQPAFNEPAAPPPPAPAADPFAAPPVDPFAADPFAADPFGGAQVADPFAGQLADPFAAQPAFNEPVAPPPPAEPVRPAPAFVEPVADPFSLDDAAGAPVSDPFAEPSFGQGLDAIADPFAGGSDSEIDSLIMSFQGEPDLPVSSADLAELAALAEPEPPSMVAPPVMPPPAARAPIAPPPAPSLDLDPPAPGEPNLSAAASRQEAATQVNQALGALNSGFEVLQSQLATLYEGLAQAAASRAPITEIVALTEQLTATKAQGAEGSMLYEQAMTLRRVADAYLRLFKTL